MKALVKSRADRGLWLEEIDEPAVGINDVLVRVRYTGICGTDVHIYEWDEWAQKTIPIPMAIGHEFVGEVVEVGANVNDFFPGNIVSGEGHVVCGRCRNCLAGRRHFCASTLGIGVNPQAMRDMVANMAHGGKIAMLGIPSQEMAIDWRQVIFNQLTIRGIYGREMYETWYKMTVMLESGVDISPVITHRFDFSDFQESFDAMISGQTGKIILDWTSLV